MKQLEGKIAVVTGGNSGIGLATAKLLRQEGARVAISGRDQATLTAAVKEIGGDTLARALARSRTLNRETAFITDKR